MQSISSSAVIFVESSERLIHPLDTVPTPGDDTIQASENGDVIDGLGGNDFISGDVGNDFLIGSEGNDSLYGGDGNDTIEGGIGSDWLGGNGGYDTVTYANASGAIHFGYAGGAGSASGADGIDNLSDGGFEKVIGSNFDDFFQTEDAFDVDAGGGNDEIHAATYGTRPNRPYSIVGGEGSDTIFAGANSSELDGGADDDNFIVGDYELGPGTAYLDGGEGNDTVDFSNCLAGIKITLSSTRVQHHFGNGHVSVSSIEDVVGTKFNDRVRVSDADNHITAWDGNDILTGLDCFDSLDAGAGRDRLLGGAGDDTLVGGGDADKLRGGGGSDTFVFNAVEDSSGSGLDRIIDLSNDDLIDLHNIDANSLKVGDQAFILVEALDGHAGELAVIAQNHHLTLLVADIDGDGDADMTVTLSGSHVDFNHFVL